MEDKQKHLEFIQTTIGRMATQSFAVKGWSVTLVAALFALAAKDADVGFILVAYFPVIMFWALDGFFLHQEKLFRKLYAAVSRDDPSIPSYSMDTSPFKAEVESWRDVMFSTTLRLFHGCIIAVILVVMLVLLIGHGAFK